MSTCNTIDVEKSIDFCTAHVTGQLVYRCVVNARVKLLLADVKYSCDPIERERTISICILYMLRVNRSLDVWVRAHVNIRRTGTLFNNLA